MLVVYSYDMNVLRALPPKGRAKCIPLGSGGRKLNARELRKVAENSWGARSIKEFRYLKEGEGYNPS